MPDPTHLAGVIRAVSAWYRAGHRDLPWRHTADPYAIWVSEIMLQQTRVEAVRPYYARFLAALPTVQDLAQCPPDRLMKLWEGLGYYSRARHLQAAAQQVVTEYGGQMPRTRAKLQKLKGIGAYTAGAIAAFAFGEPVPAVDGNVLRVMARVFGDDRDVLLQTTKNSWDKYLTAALAQCAAAPDRCMQEASEAGTAGQAGAIPQKEDAHDSLASAFNQGLMDLGAGVCLPHAKPLCEVCPLATQCVAHAEGREMELPVRIKKQRRRAERRTVLVIRSGTMVAIRQREQRGLLAGLYELPNASGHLTEAEALAWATRLGFEPLHIAPLPAAKHLFTHIEWQLIGYEIRIADVEETAAADGVFLAPLTALQGQYAIPSAFAAYRAALQ